MIILSNSPQLAPADGEQKTGGVKAENTVQVIRNANAARFGFATKLIPVWVDGVLTAWEETHINSRLTEVRRASPQALRAAGLRVAFEDYDPIMASAARAARNGFKPVWTGD